jgi:hypothetical protein
MYTLLSPLPSAIINTLIQVAYGFTIIRRYTFDVYLNVTHEITMNKDIRSVSCSHNMIGRSTAENGMLTLQ